MESLRIAVLENVLTRLVDLKDYKDKHGKDELYKKEQPYLWDLARRALNEKEYEPGDLEKQLDELGELILKFKYGTHHDRNRAWKLFLEFKQSVVPLIEINKLSHESTETI